jgi:hypothetical protein
MKNELIKRRNNQNSCQVLVAHTCNPSYSGDRDQEDLGLKPELGQIV